MNNLNDKNAILYRRVSTTAQKVFGNSLNAQQSILRDFLSFCYNLEIVKSSKGNDSGNQN